MLVPIMIVMLIQAGIFCAAIMSGGVLQQLGNNAIDILNERVINRKNYLENEMIQRWSNISSDVESVQSTVADILDTSGKSYSDINPNADLTDEILKSVTNKMVYLLRKNSVTGAFLIFHGQDDLTASTKEVHKAGIYLRDLDPVTNPNDNSDLLWEFAPISITRHIGIPMDTNWTPTFTFSPEEKEAWDYYYKPFLAAVQYPDSDFEDLGYWCPPFKLSEDDVSIITYSVPLISADGVPYGVMGVEITTDYLHTLLPYDEITSAKNGAYAIGVAMEGSSDFKNVITSGSLYKQLLGDSGQTSLGKVEGKNTYLLENVLQGRPKAYGCVQYFNIYNTNTPFEQEQWALMGIIERQELFSFSYQLTTTLIVILVLSLLIGLVGISLITSRLSKPITSLVKKVKASNPMNPVALEKIGIAEIDELTDAVEQLSHSVAESSSKLSQILEMANYPIAAFEYLDDSDQVFYASGVFRILGSEEMGQQSGYISPDLFEEMLCHALEGTQLEREDQNTTIYNLTKQLGKPRYVRLKLYYEGKHVLGVLVDITQEILEKKKLEYERDYDLLTNLLNRRAFHRMMVQSFRKPEMLKNAALIMMDLDNLKYINDNYGHDFGDEYIRCTASVLKLFSPYQVLLSRMSGDEFHIFIYGYDTREEIRKIIEEMKDTIRKTEFPLPDNHSFRIRASAGVAWYPDDSTDYETLVKYADFAMYKVKNTTKGEFTDFDIGSYNKDSYLLHSREELNRLIDEELVDYHFQPIVDTHTGRVFAYEALMRSKLSTLQSPLDILRLARSQSKLYQIEHLTWFKSMENFANKIPADSGCKIFINSIPNQALTDQDMDSFERMYGKYLDRMVVELTEDEKLSEEFTVKKEVCLRRWNGSLALDDFGTGYNGDATLLSLRPDYVKIDMSIIRGIDTDDNRRKILQNLISYTKERSIKTIAEGVETRGEMDCLIANGVDYLQGFYIGHPSMDPCDIDPSVRQEILEASGKDALEEASHETH
ncbi:EAL domain-containing protein [Zongyangia hominis]|nr:EAL domain-containing protein [Zongyangia hominis]